ncbi:DUF6705 family protein [Mucilaginibacter myungsuensis]|uniref:DUF6705 domain-containing protein n=1 Tax=Mucilaginibacter myungsuensis TaxID=649104 RepID=A0A929PWM3_9SPHI|nr:DUF6705 family protein [Mucilaginibacter myungsuensis]MBE9662241.1 hypothetical protein [Mucilaginibacter myungsuensis]MDN3599323.1 hypothetical protein [Mucilaginibacter myungsuensis]
MIVRSILVVTLLLATSASFGQSPKRYKHPELDVYNGVWVYHAPTYDVKLKLSTEQVFIESYNAYADFLQGSYVGKGVEERSGVKDLTKGILLKKDTVQITYTDDASNNKQTQVLLIFSADKKSLRCSVVKREGLTFKANGKDQGEKNERRKFSILENVTFFKVE